MTEQSNNPQVENIDHLRDGLTSIARIAAFAETREYPHNMQLVKQIGRVATAFREGENVVTENKRYDGRVESLEHNPESFMQFMREADSETLENIAFLANKMRAYEVFRGTAESALQGGSVDSSHFLGVGLNGSVYGFEQNGERYAVKKGGVSFFNIEAWRRGEGVDGNISRLEAVDLESEVAVMNLVEGRTSESMSYQERQQIPDQHIADMIDLIVEMHNAGLIIDPKPSNFIYSEQSGFGIIDYHSQDSKSMAPVTAAEQVVSSHAMLSYTSDWPPYGTPDYEERVRENYDQIVTMNTRFLDILELNHPEILTEAAEVQARINSDPSMSSSGMLGSAEGMPDEERFNAYRQRIKELRLAGGND